MDIKIELAKTLKEKPADETKLGFGHIFTDHMFIMNYDTGEGWHDARIVPYQNLSLSPASMCLHYGQEIFEGLVEDHQHAFVKAVITADMFGPIIDFCWGFGAMMLYLVGIRFLGFEKVSVGLLVAFASYINMFWNPIMNLSNFYNNLITNLTAAERVFDIMDTPADIVDAPDVRELPDVKGKVEFSHVTFTYDRGTPAETKVLEITQRLPGRWM